jgi:hypothetical protein
MTKRKHELSIINAAIKLRDSWAEHWRDVDYKEDEGKLVSSVDSYKKHKPKRSKKWITKKQKN